MDILEATEVLYCPVLYNIYRAIFVIPKKINSDVQRQLIFWSDYVVSNKEYQITKIPKGSSSNVTQCMWIC